MNRIGTVFALEIFGESHGNSVGGIVDGCPPGIALEADDFTKDLARRKSGAKGTTARRETDAIEILGGLCNGFTTGSPIAFLFRNGDAMPGDYSEFSRHPRPGHADFTAGIKYGGFADLRGGGHFSGRLTLAYVAAGVIAKKILPGCVFFSRLTEIGGEKNPLEFDSVIAEAVKDGDSVGGVVECTVSGLAAGLGEPFFDSVEAGIAHLLFSVPGVRGVEFGRGFDSARQLGSAHNDAIIDSAGHTATNNSGGINGGITNGNELVFRLAVKPASSISREQSTWDFGTQSKETLSVAGRHDACIALRVPVIAEAACAIALADFVLRARAAKGKY